MAIIHSAKNDFDSVEVREWVQSQDAQGTKQAGDMITEINGILFRDVVDTLKRQFGDGEKEWWMKGVPPKVRIECDKQFNESFADHERWQFLYLINYVEIVTYGENWDLFKDYYNFYIGGKKTERLRWIVRLNKARQITHHAEKGPLPRDQIEYVRRVHALVKKHIEQREKLDPKVSYLSD
jgi:hypothetical protein